MSTAFIALVLAVANAAGPASPAPRPDRDARLVATQRAPQGVAKVEHKTMATGMPVVKVTRPTGAGGETTRVFSADARGEFTVLEASRRAFKSGGQILAERNPGERPFLTRIAPDGKEVTQLRTPDGRFTSHARSRMEPYLGVLPPEGQGVAPKLRERLATLRLAGDVAEIPPDADKTGLFDALRSEPIHYGVFEHKAADGTVQSYVVRGTHEGLVPRSAADKPVFLNHPKGALALSPSEVAALSRTGRASVVVGTPSGLSRLRPPTALPGVRELMSARWLGNDREDISYLVEQYGLRPNDIVDVIRTLDDPYPDTLANALLAGTDRLSRGANLLDRAAHRARPLPAPRFDAAAEAPLAEGARPTIEHLQALDPALAPQFENAVLRAKMIGMVEGRTFEQALDPIWTSLPAPRSAAAYYRAILQQGRQGF